MSSLRYNRGLRLLDISLNWAGPNAIRSCLDGLKRKIGLGEGSAGDAWAASMCFVRAEVSEDFRQIERIKAGDWRGVIGHDEGSQVEAAEDISNPFAPLAAGSGSRDNLSPPSYGSNPFGPIEPDPDGLRHGQQIPKGLGDSRDTVPSPSSTCLDRSSGGGTWSSCKRQCSTACTSSSSIVSSTEEECLNDKADSDPTREFKSKQSLSDYGCLVAGVTGSSGGGARSQRLKRELDGCEGLIDGSCNLKLPVSFPAIAASIAKHPYDIDDDKACDNPFAPNAPYIYDNNPFNRGLD